MILAPVLAPVIFTVIGAHRHFRRHQSFPAPDSGTSRRQLFLTGIVSFAASWLSAPDSAPVQVPVILPKISPHQHFRRLQSFQAPDTGTSHFSLHYFINTP
jgi:hypothetical protein